MRSSLLPVLCTALLTACGGDEAGTGTVDVSVWGEDFIEEEIPASELVDGWSVTFDRFLVVVGDVTFANADGGEASLPGLSVFNLVMPGPHAMGSTEPIEATSWQSVGYRLAVATADTTAHASATDDDLLLMQDGGYDVYVEGSATNGTDTKTFRWGFTSGVRYSDCVDVRGGQDTKGVVVTTGSSIPMQITIHGDHFFYDDLQSSDAQRRFDNLAAADADMDGEVTLDELSQVPLANLPLDNGPYGVGASDVNDLGGYVRAAAHTLGHFNGEGHCVDRVE